MLIGIIAVIAVFWFIRATTIISLPVATAVFIAMLLRPLQNFLAARLRPKARWAVLPLTMLVLLAVVAAAAGLAGIAVSRAIETAPRYGERLSGLSQRASDWARSQQLPVPEELLQRSDVKQRLAQLAEGSLVGVGGFLSGLVLVFFLTLLMLLEADDWQEKIRAHGSRAAPPTTEVASVVAVKVRQYFGTQAIVSLLSGVVEGAWLFAMGVDLALLWGVLFFVLNYVPTLGSIIAVIPPSLLALLQFGPGKGLLVIAGLVVFEQILGNYVDPRLQGRRLRISAVVILVSLVFWTWVWGAAGAVLAVPMTVFILIASAHVPGLEWLARLLSGTADPDEFRSHTTRT